MEITIRELERSDIQAVTAIVKAIYPQDLPEMLLNDLNDAWSNAKIKPFFFVAEENGTITGFAGFSENTMTYHSYNLFWCMVHPIWQRKGIGTKLTEYRLKEIKRRGGKYVLVHADVPMFTQQFGFKEIDRYEGAPVMALQIS